MLGIIPIAFGLAFSAVALAIASVVSGSSKGSSESQFRQRWNRPLSSDQRTLVGLRPEVGSAAKAAWLYEMDTSREQLLLEQWHLASHEDQKWILQQWAQLPMPQKRLLTFFLCQSASELQPTEQTQVAPGSTPSQAIDQLVHLSDVIAMSGGLLGTQGTSEVGNGYVNTERVSAWGFFCGQHMQTHSNPAIWGESERPRVGISDLVAGDWYEDPMSPRVRAVAVRTPKQVGWDKVDLGGWFFTDMEPQIPFDQEGREWLFKNCDVWGDRGSINSMLGVLAEDAADLGDNSFLALTVWLQDECDWGKYLSFDP